MTVNPCCMPLQKGVKLMAIVDIILNVLNIFFVGFAIIAVIALKDRLADETDLTASQVNVGIVALVVMLLIGILGLLLSIRLLNAAKNREIRFCKIWLIISFIIVTITLLSNILNLSAGESTLGNATTSFIGLLYRLYMIWVVHSFIQELRTSSTNGLDFQGRMEQGIVYTVQTYPYSRPPDQAGVVYSVPSNYAGGNVYSAAGGVRPEPPAPSEFGVHKNNYGNPYNGNM